MRLTPSQVEVIKKAALECFGSETEVLLFGSRVDDQKRGGDIDLLIRPAPPVRDQSVTRKIRFLGLLERSLGERKIDVVIEAPGDQRPIVKVASQTGVRL